MGVIENKTIWITGASSGIGKALALQYADRKYNLILSARRKDELEKVAELCVLRGAQCLVLPLDLSNIQEAKSLILQAKSFKGKIDILVNNGGISQRSLAIDTNMEVLRKIMEVNFFGQVTLSAALLPVFLESGGGQYVVISSLTGKFGYGLRSAYAASKHALHGYFESLAIENHQHNIHVSMICPGRILTDISMNALSGDGSTYGKLDEGQKKGLDVTICAQKIVKAVDQKQREIFIGKFDVVMVYLKRFFPALFFKIALRLDPRK